MPNYSKGTISIPNVTGDVVITIVATESAPPYTNLAVPSEFVDNARLNSSGETTALSGNEVTNYFTLSVGDVVRVKGINVTVNNNRISFYTDTAYVGGIYCTTAESLSQFFSDITLTSDYFEGKLTIGSQITRSRIGGTLNGTKEQVIITINEPIE